jgi:hypothetical protein
MTATSKGLNSALAVRAHAGWAAYVVLRGDPKAPEIAARGRMELFDPALEESKMLFHAAEPMPFARAESYIDKCRAATAKRADLALENILKENGPIAGCCVLTASGKPLPELKAILASHALIHAAEGVFYRDAVADACKRRKIAVQRIRERDIAEESNMLPLSEVARRDALGAFGKQVGSPWTQDEKLSALGAWLVLAARGSIR